MLCGLSALSRTAALHSDVRRTEGSEGAWPPSAALLRPVSLSRMHLPPPAGCDCWRRRCALLDHGWFSVLWESLKDTMLPWLERSQSCPVIMIYSVPRLLPVYCRSIVLVRFAAEKAAGSAMEKTHKPDDYEHDFDPDAYLKHYFAR